MGLLRQRDGRMTIAQAEELGAEASSLLNYWQRNEKLAQLMQAALREPTELWRHGSRAVRGLGAPLVRMRGYEATPGLWVFDDAPSGIVFLVWSDGYKKHPWKGTSYEAIASAVQEAALPEAYTRLMAYLRSKLPDPGTDEL